MYKVAIIGYGNLGKGVSLALEKVDDIECVGIFTRRDPASVKPVTDLKVYSVD